METLRMNGHQASPAQPWAWADILGLGTNAADIQEQCPAIWGLSLDPGDAGRRKPDSASSVKLGLGMEAP